MWNCGGMVSIRRDIGQCFRVMYLSVRKWTHRNCQSEHEGFCVPLVEAMYFKIPIVAYDSTAVGETLGGSGICLEKKDPVETAGMMDYILTHEETRKKLILDQELRRKDFSYERTKDVLLAGLREVWDTVMD